jgi:hypothetical protein
MTGVSSSIVSFPTGVPDFRALNRDRPDVFTQTVADGRAPIRNTLPVFSADVQETSFDFLEGRCNQLAFQTVLKFVDHDVSPHPLRTWSMCSTTAPFAISAP